MAETALSFAIVLFAILVGFGLIYGTATGAWEDYRSARDAEIAGDSEALRTELNVTNATWDEGDPLVDGDEFLNVTVNNTGSTTLSVNGTDLLIDGRYANYSSPNVTTTVDGTDTDVWAPGTTLRIVVDDGFLRDLFGLDLTDDAEPARIVFVSGPGVSDQEDVD